MEGSLVILNEREPAPRAQRVQWVLTTPLGGKMAPALRVEAKKAPLCVAPHYFGTTKARSPRLDWRFFSHNAGDPISVNRPLREPVQ